MLTLVTQATQGEVAQQTRKAGQLVVWSDAGLVSAPVLFAMEVCYYIQLCTKSALDAFPLAGNSETSTETPDLYPLRLQLCKPATQHAKPKSRGPKPESLHSTP